MGNLTTHPKNWSTPFKWQLALVLLFIMAYSINLTLRPLTLEEPRRLIVSMEMLENGNYWAPTWYGTMYVTKPPLFNWLQIGFIKMLGQPGLLAARLPTVLSAFGIALMLWLLGRRHEDATFGALTALLWLGSVDILFYFSMLGEIDVFYALLTFGGMAATFHFYQAKKPWLLFLSAYGLGTLGFLTKGPPAVLFTGLTVVGYLAYRRDWRMLLHPAHFTGIAMFVALTGLYFWQYSFYADVEALIEKQWRESSRRTAAGNTFLRLLRHMYEFPLDTMKTHLPATVFLLFLTKKSWNTFKLHPWPMFALLVFVINFLIPYEFSPGTRQRYIYPLYPFGITALTLLYYTAPDRHWGHRVLQGLSVFFSLILTAAGPAMLWVEDLDFLPYRSILAGGLTLTGLAMLYFSWSKPKWSVYHILAILAISRIVMDLTFFPLKAHDSHDQANKQVAHDIVAIAKGEKLYIEERDFISGTTMYELHLLRGERVQHDSTFRQDGLYIVRQSQLDSTRDFRTVHTFSSGHEEYLLLRYQ